MPDTIKISELDEALAIADAAEFPYTQENGGENTTFKAPLTQIAAKIVEDMSYAGIDLPAGAGVKSVENTLNYLLGAVGGNPNENIATEYDPTETYAKGDYCIYENVLYICTDSNGTTGTFDPTAWSQTELAEHTAQNAANVGDLSQLTTTDKSSLVGAINEIASYTPVYGNTASGAIATFDTSLALPLQDCTIAINAVQEGSGTPSPDNVRPITGFTECNVTRTGKNLINPTLSPDGNPRINSVTVTKGYDNVILTTTATVDYMCYGVFYSLKKGTYTFKYQANSSDSYTPSVTIYRQGSAVLRIVPNTAKTFTLAEDATIEVRMFASTIGNGVVGRVVTFYEMQLELGTTATAYEAYNGTTTAISWQSEAGTVSEGSLNVTTGKLTVVNGSMGAGDYQITPIPINQLSGTNNIFCDTGNTSVVYACSLKDYIEGQ